MHSHITSQFKFNFDTDTIDSEIKAPKQKPMEPCDLPPQLMLEKIDISTQFNSQILLNQKSNGIIRRKGSLDIRLTILGFMDKNIREKSRQRIMSQELSDLRL